MHIVHIEQRSQHETWLIGGLEHEFFMTFHTVGNVIIPTDEHIFQRGRAQPHFSAARASGRITWPAAKERLALSASQNGVSKWRLKMGYPGYPY